MHSIIFIFDHSQFYKNVQNIESENYTENHIIIRFSEKPIIHSYSNVKCLHFQPKLHLLTQCSKVTHTRFKGHFNERESSLLKLQVSCVQKLPGMSTRNKKLTGRKYV